MLDLLGVSIYDPKYFRKRQDRGCDSHYRYSSRKYHEASGLTPFQIGGMLEQGMVEILPAYGSDQTFHKGMGCWGIGDGLDFFDLKDP